jgi:hypothetical protein
MQATPEKRVSFLYDANTKFALVYLCCKRKSAKFNYYRIVFASLHKLAHGAAIRQYIEAAIIP